MATEAIASSNSALAMNNNNKMENGGGAASGASNGSSNKMLPSFSDILWCPDIDGDVMSHSSIGGAMVMIFNASCFPRSSSEINATVRAYFETSLEFNSSFRGFLRIDFTWIISFVN